MSERSIDIELAGTHARLSTSHADFAEYAAVHLAPLAGRSTARPQVSARLTWHEGQPPHDRIAADPQLAGLERIDRDLYRGEGRLAWFRIDELPDLQLEFRWDGEHLQVSGDFFYRLSADRRRDQLKRWLYRHRVAVLRQRRYTTLLYYLIYYPCFWWLERQRGLHPIHASGVDVGSGVVVMAGPSGVGKSTLAAGLASQPGARFLSDTFLLQKDTQVRAVPEPLLLDEWSRGWLGEQARLLRPIEWRYCLDRAGYHWPAERRSDGGLAGLLLFPYRATTPSVRRLTPARAHGQIAAGNAIVNDLRRYWAFAAALEMLDPTALGAAREAGLAALVDEVPGYEVGLTRDLALPQVIETVAGLLAGTVPQRGPARSLAV